MKVRALSLDDFERWKILYQGYQAFYKVSATELQLKTTFSWIMDNNHPQCGLGVEKDNTLIGLAHYQILANPILASQRMYLNDIFIDPSHRGSGCADMMMQALLQICQAQNLECLRLMTQKNNHRARAVYDKYAKPYPFMTYQATFHPKA